MRLRSLTRLVGGISATLLVGLATWLPIIGQAVGVGSSRGQSTPLIDSIKPLVDRGELPGAVLLVASKDKVLALETTGTYDGERKQSYQTDALFGTASQGKTFTALGIMMLVDEGKIKLDDPVSKYLPEFKDVKIWRMVNEHGSEQLRLTKPVNRLLVRHVLGHTSGLNDPLFFRGQYLAGKVIPQQSQFPKPQVDSLSVTVQRYTIDPLTSEPGSKFSYSAVGPEIAGRLIEVISGTSYKTFLLRRLMIPLGMKASAEWLSAQTNRTSPAGGLAITAEDNARFGQMLLNGGLLDGKRFISEKSLNLMRRVRTGQLQGDGANYPLGLVINDEHSFSTGGASGTWMWIDIKHGLVIVFMTRGHSDSKIGEAHKAFLAAAIAKFGSVSQ